MKNVTLFLTFQNIRTQKYQECCNELIICPGISFNLSPAVTCLRRQVIRGVERYFSLTEVLTPLTVNLIFTPLI